MPDSKEGSGDKSKGPPGPHKSLNGSRASGKKGITFAAQDELPQLPIPDLDSSLKKYLDALHPLQTPKERSDSEAAVQEFLKHDGPELQEKLRTYAKGKTNYIEQFCTDACTCQCEHVLWLTETL